MDPNNTFDLLFRIPIFQCLSAQAVHLIAFSGDQMRFRRGDVIFAAGHKSDGGHLVLEGQVDLFPTRALSAPAQIVSVGGLIGEAALLAPTERPVWAIAATDCMTLKITRGAVCRVLSEFPESAEDLHRIFFWRVKSMLAELSVWPTANRSLPS